MSYELKVSRYSVIQLLRYSVRVNHHKSVYALFLFIINKK